MEGKGREGNSWKERKLFDEKEKDLPLYRIGLGHGRGHYYSYPTLIRLLSDYYPTLTLSYSLILYCILSYYPVSLKRLGKIIRRLLATIILAELSQFG